MPKKNKTACKRRKCQRSRRLSRNHNRRRVRTIRRGGWPWTRKPTPPTPTFIETLLEKNEEFRYRKYRLDQEKMLRDASEKRKRETEERNLLWLQQKQQQEQQQKQQQKEQQEAQWQKQQQQSKPTRSPEEGYKYRAALGGLAEAWDAHVKNPNPNDSQRAE